jgi:peptide/nickel transport system permease protein
VNAERAAVEPRRRRSRGLAQFLHSRVGMVAAVLFLLIVLVCFVGPLVLPWSPDELDAGAIAQAPSTSHLLGTDVIGRDVFARILIGGRVNLLGAGLALLVSLVVGVPAGLVAGYRGGTFDAVTNWLTDLVIAVPAIIVLLAVSSIVGPSVWIAMSVFGVILAPSFYRLVRAEVMAVRSELYIDAARVSGLSDTRIVGRHILSVVRGPVIIQSAFVLGLGIAIQAGLEFLGLGDQTHPSWGQMLNQGFRNIYRAPRLIFPPVGVIVISTLLLALIANALRDALAEASSGAGDDVGPSDDRPAGLDVDGAGSLMTVRGLTVAYPVGAGLHEVVRSTSLRVDRGEVVGLVGESGSGKTQTAYAILGLLAEGGRVLSGSLDFAGDTIELNDSDATGALRGRRIGYVPQEPLSNLAPSFRIARQLVDPMRLHLGLDRREATRRAGDLLERVGISEPGRILRSYSHELSGGLAQRVLIAGAVACDPELLIADEPTTALDVTTQAEVLELLRGLQRERGMGMLLVTHNFGVVADICDRVAVMCHGTILEAASAQDLFDAPQHPYTRELLAASLEGGPARAPYTGSGVS